MEHIAVTTLWSKIGCDQKKNYKALIEAKKNFNILRSVIINIDSKIKDLRLQ